MRREIIRLKSLEFSNVAIANSLGSSCNTVSKVHSLAETHSLGWPIRDALTNSDIEHLFYPNRGNNEGDSQILSIYILCTMSYSVLFLNTMQSGNERILNSGIGYCIVKI